MKLVGVNVATRCLRPDAVEVSRHMPVDAGAVQVPVPVPSETVTDPSGMPVAGRSRYGARPATGTGAEQ